MKISVGSVGALSAGASLAINGACTKSTNRPNILFLFTDQQTLRALSCYGNKYVHTPHMDSIAANGVRFENSYCTSPVCSPSRSSLITGLMPHQTGVNVNDLSIDPTIRNMGMIFRQAGYKTAWAGKWHLPNGFPRATSVPGFDYLAIKPDKLGAKTDDPIADQAIKFLREKHTRPFLLCVSLQNPHDICYWIVRKSVEYPDEKNLPPLPPNFAIDPDEPEFIRQCRRRTYYGAEITHTKNWDEKHWRTYLYAYYRLVEKVDRVVGRILTALREQGLEEETLIVFTSDHGEGVAAHHWVVKLMLYEEPVTVPLIVSWKGVTPSDVADKTHLTFGADVLPTLCDYAGISMPNAVVGKSLRPVIDNPELAGHEFVVSELQPFPKEPQRRGRMLRTAKYKYIVFSEGHNPEMLFDLETDPGETNNLAGDVAMQEVLRRHRQLLADWIEKTSDDFAIPSG